MKNMEMNRVYCGNCIDLLQQLEDNSIDLIITSPPYNKGSKKDNKSNIFYSTMHYEGFKDDIEENIYQEFEIKWLKIAYDKLKPGASLFYNHKERTNGKGGTIRPDEWLCKTPFKDTIRQQIIWDKGGTYNNCKVLCSDNKEYIYWMTKPDKNGKVRTNKQKFMNENGKFETLSSIWKFCSEKHKAFEHPAVFPVGLPLRCLHLILGQAENFRLEEGEQFIVLDPFFGTGTTGVAASSYNGVDWLGFELVPAVAEKAQQRLDNFKKNLKPIENSFLWD